MHEEKRLLRQQAAARISALPAEYLRSAGRDIAAHIAALPEYARARTVLAFAGTSREIDTGALFSRVLADEKRLALPLCIGAGWMEARLVAEPALLRPGMFGIREPAADWPAVPPQEIDLAVIPCAACDRSGRRLGHGGGYYDRYLSAWGGTAVLACPEALVMERIPQEPFDIAVSILVTERGAWRSGIPA